MKKQVSILIATLFTLITIFNYAPAKAATVPQLQMVTQPATEYHPGDRISFTVTSPNYGGKVEYRVILYNGTTKKTSELWSNMPGYYYKNWQPSGNYSFTINWPVIGMEPGAYSLTVLVRRVGGKGAYDSFVKTNAFWVKDNISVENNTTNTNLRDKLTVKEMEKKNASVKQFNQVISEVYPTNESISELKYYSNVSKYYKDMGNLGEMLKALSESLSLAFEGINRNYDMNYIDTSNKRLNEIINTYNDVLNPTSEFIENAKVLGIDISDMNLIISKYSNAIDYYKLSINSLYDYRTNPTQYSFNNYLNNNSNGFNAAFDGVNLCDVGYNKFYDILQNNNSNDEKFKKLKFYSYISNYYRDLSEFGDWLKLTTQRTGISFRYISTNTNLNHIDNVSNDFNKVIDSFNDSIDPTAKLIEDAKVNGIDIRDLNTILLKYRDAIEFYKKSIDELSKYRSSRMEVNSDEYWNNGEQAFYTSYEGIQLSDDGYNKFYDLIQSY